MKKMNSEKKIEELKKDAPEQVKKTYEEIKKLNIQGATDVALEAARSLKKIEEKQKLKKSIELLKRSRPTEPMMRNGLRYIKSKHGEGKETERAVKEFEEMVQDSVKEITKKGAKYLPEETSIMTHCHSSLVEKIITKADEKGKIEKVIAPETRPKYQGRTTAKKLAEKGVDVTVCVDSAKIEMLEEADLAMVGADVITSDSYLFNKIGTHELALSANVMKGKSFLVATQLLKIAPETLEGKREEVEERNPEEVWKNPPDGVKIRNPAFDATPPKYINSMVTEHGIIHPFNAIDNARRKYPWIFEE